MVTTQAVVADIATVPVDDLQQLRSMLCEITPNDLTYWESLFFVELKTLGRFLAEHRTGRCDDLRIYTSEPGPAIVKIAGEVPFELVDELAFDPGYLPFVIQGYRNRPKRPGLLTEIPNAKDTWELGKKFALQTFEVACFGSPDIVLTPLRRLSEDNLLQVAKLSSIPSLG